MKQMVVVLFGIFLLTTVAYAQTPPPAAPKAAVGAMHKRDRFPEMHRAMRKLRMAKQDLEKAAHDYDGHRVKAIAAVNQAMEEIKLGIQSEKSEREEKEEKGR